MLRNLWLAVPGSLRSALRPKSWREIIASTIALATLVFSVITFIATQRAELRARNLETLMRAAELIGDDKGPSTRSGAIVTVGSLANEGNLVNKRQLVVFLEHFIRDHASGRELPSRQKSANWPTVDLRAAIALLIETTVDMRDDAGNPYVVDMRNIKLRNADLSFLTSLRHWDLRGAELVGATLPSIQFDQCDLSGADLSDAIMPHTIWKKCNLDGARFVGTTLEWARFGDCRARKADFTNANLNLAAITNTDLEKAVFERTKLGDTDLAGSTVRYVNFANIELPGRPGYQFALGDKSTILPAAYARPENW